MVKDLRSSRKRSSDKADYIGRTDPEQDWLGFDLVTGGEMRTDEQVRQFVRKYGYYMSLRKMTMGKCECVLAFAGSPDPNCRQCFGEGRSPVDHIVLGRKYTPRPEIGSEQRAPLGIVHTHAPLFIIEPILSSQDAPTTDDYIVELVLEPDRRTPLRPYQIRCAYKVTHVDEMRDLKGDVAFYQVRCEEKAWELK